MSMSRRAPEPARALPLLLGLALLSPVIAHAQDDDPEAGEVGSAAQETKPSPNTWGTGGSGAASTEGSGSASATPEWGEDAVKSATDNGESDHEAVVGRVGVGLLGLAEIPVGVNAGSARAVDPVLTAPILGARYWISDRFGLEAGIGFMFRGGSVTDSTGNKGDVSSRAFALSAGLPIALTWGKHYNVLAIPYFGLGFSKVTDGRGDAITTNDVFGSGILFEAGLRAGVEVQLGAVGLEGFALQLTGALRLRIEKTSADIPIPSDDEDTPPDSYDVDTSSVVFATSQGSTLGSSIAGCIAAVYYF
jgi:hypothetical protein